MRKLTSDELRAEINRLKAKYHALADDVRAAADAIERDEDPRAVMGRLTAKISDGFAGRRWSDEEIVAAGWEWFHRHGESPAATSWNPALLKSKSSSAGALERYYDGDWPSTATAVRRFGSWTAFLDAAKLPHNERPPGTGMEAGGFDHLPTWTGWQLLPGLRDKLGITQGNLAERAGLSHSTVQGLEVGRHTNPQLRIFLALSQALRIRPAYLLEGEVDTGASAPPA